MPGALLAAVLQRVEREVGQPGDVAAGRVDAEDAAHQTASIARGQGVLVGRARLVQRTSSASSAAAQGDARRRPARPIRSSGTSAASQAVARRSSSSGAQVTTTSPQLSPKSVAAAPCARGSSVASRPTPAASATSASATARPPSETSCAEPSTPLARELGEQVAEPAQRRAGRPRGCARRPRRRERLPLRAVVGGHAPCRAAKSVPLPPAGAARTAQLGALQHADAADDGRRVDRPPAALVVERDVARDDRRAEHLAGLGHARDGLAQRIRACPGARGCRS